MWGADESRGENRAEVDGFTCLVGPRIPAHLLLLPHMQGLGSEKLYFPDFLAARALSPLRFHHVNTVVGAEVRQAPFLLLWAPFWQPGCVSAASSVTMSLDGAKGRHSVLPLCPSV